LLKRKKEEETMNISGKTAIVTGGASGLGAATVKRLHRAGASVVLADLNVVKGPALVEELKERVLFAHMDVTEEESVKAAIDLTMNTFKKIDILINCAGTGWAMRTVSKNGPHDLSIFKKIIAINLIGTFDCVRHAAFHMQNNEPNEDGERGVIVNTASVAAFDGQIGQAAYSASKAGVVGMTLTIARDLARSGIRCCTIAPGIFDTALTGFLSEQVRSSLAEQTPFPQRLGKADEFAMLAEQIVVNPMLNGETIRLDGAIRMAPK
jgi:NAD(P)-dependent dehydrogenase (short-subunit alcohol dehydrogenase family)